MWPLGMPPRPSLDSSDRSACRARAHSVCLCACPMTSFGMAPDMSPFEVRFGNSKLIVTASALLNI